MHDETAGWQSSSSIPVGAARRGLLLVLAIVLVAGAGLISNDNLYSSGIPAWDAGFYTSVARDLPGVIAGKTPFKLGLYSSLRIFPSVVVYIFFKLTGLPASDQNLILAFCWLDALMVMLVGIIWLKIAARLGLSGNGTWIGLLSLLINFAVLKHRAYDPILTDMTAFGLGASLLYCYLTKRTVLMLILAFVGSFTWPTLFLQSAILLLFPFRGEAPDTEVTGLARGAARLVCLGSALGMALFLFYLKKTDFQVGLVLYPITFYPAAVLSCGYLAFGLLPILRRLLGEWRYILRELLKARAFCIAAALAAILFSVIVLRNVISSPEGFNYSFMSFLSVTAWVSILFPLAFLVAHPMYLGPIVLITVFLWRDVVRISGELGYGMPISLGFCVILSLNSESRMMLNFYPTIVLLTVLALEKRFEFKGGFTVVFAVLLLVISKVWLWIGPLQNGPTGNILRDNQKLFMNNGPAMSGQSYLIHLLATLATAGVLTFMLARSRKTFNS